MVLTNLKHNIVWLLKYKLYVIIYDDLSVERVSKIAHWCYKYVHVVVINYITEICFYVVAKLCILYHNLVFIYTIFIINYACLFELNCSNLWCNKLHHTEF